MTPPVELFIILVTVGMVLLGIEVFVPGGVIGIMGGLALFSAMIAGFYAFGSEGGWLATGLMIVLGGFALAIWIKLFPRTPFGRRMTLSTDGRANKSVPDRSRELLGQLGTAQTDLRPGGVALIAGQRLDVVSESGYVDSGTAVNVVAVQGSRVVVRAQRTT